MSRACVRDASGSVGSCCSSRLRAPVRQGCQAVAVKPLASTARPVGSRRPTSQPQTHCYPILQVLGKLEFVNRVAVVLHTLLKEQCACGKKEASLEGGHRRNYLRLYDCSALSGPTESDCLPLLIANSGKRF